MKKTFLYALAMLAIAVSACDDFGDINDNPNASETPLTSALLTNAQAALGGSVAGGTAFTAGMYGGYFSQTQYTDNSRYAIQDASWAGEMAGSMYDLKQIININSDPATAPTAALQGSNANQIAIARILLAYRFSIITDRYGDIPYFEALQGNTQPTIDPQEDVYADLFKELSEAVNQFDDNGNVKGDLVYGGDNLKWKKFANSLRVILALRISDVDPTEAQAQFQAALAADGGVFESNTDNAILPYPGGSYINPWVAIAADQGVSETVATTLNSTGDARRYAFGDTIAGGTLKGFPYGLKREDAVAWGNANPGWSLILDTERYRQNNSPLFILTQADVLLARAEAKFRWPATEALTTQQLYDSALAQSWRQWGVYDADEFDDFLSNAQNNLATNTEAKIATQRWLTFFPNGPQGWSEWRRTGFPNIPLAVEPLNETGVIPRRFYFASQDYNYNGANVEAAATRMGGDDDATRVWWDID